MLSAEGLEEEGGYKSLLPTISIDERKCQATENKGNRQFGVCLSSQSTRHRQGDLKSYASDTSDISGPIPLTCGTRR
jgi:hypothetical protein